MIHIRDSNSPTINTVEVTCPYGGHTDIQTTNDEDDNNNYLTSKLKIRRDEKLGKNNALIEDIKDNWYVKAKLFMVIVSSLEVIPKDVITNLKRLRKTKNIVTLVVNKYVAATIIGSFNIFYNAKLSYPLNDLEIVVK